MKTTRFSLLLALAFLSSCFKEQIPSGLLLTDVKNTSDSTYITGTIPAAQTKKILFEEATGVHCSNCPGGAKILRDLKTAYPGKILSIAIYSEFLNYFQAPSKYDFNSADAMTLVNFIEGKDPSKPASCIDRLPTGDPNYPYFFKKDDWAAKVSAIKDKTTPLNLEMSVSPTGTTDEYRVKSTVTFTQAWTGDIAMTLCLIEDHVIDYQDSDVVKIPNYEHNHVLRKLITPVSGSTFKNAVPAKEAGRVYEKFITFTLPTNILDKTNCHLVGYIHKTGSEKEIIHAQEIELE